MLAGKGGGPVLERRKDDERARFSTREGEQKLRERQQLNFFTKQLRSRTQQLEL